MKPATDSDFWNQRFLEPGWAYGTEPNDFLKAQAGHIPMGEVLCLAEGEGRNAVHLAALGYAVSAMDFSSTGLAKAQALALERGVNIHTFVADLGAFDPGEGRWQGIVSIFVHPLTTLRRALHQHMVRALAPGGVILLEAYATNQLKLGTGGPREPERLCSLEDLTEDFAGLETMICHELERDVQEGKYHRGTSAVLQFMGRKP
ncbi:MAG: class I SAM-dependent methyltransferase [Holophaga sp.]